MFYDFLHGATLVESQRRFNDIELQVSKDEPIDERNTAMSVVAELFGMDKLLAHSETVKIKDGDKIKEGTLMDFAEGVDINNIDPKSDIAKVTQNNVIVTTEAKKQIADLQLLDYVCGNLDRHAANLFYQYDMTNPERPKLIGVQGIDNDCSFYKNDKTNSLKGRNQMVGLASLIAIDKKTAQKLKTITPSMLKISLQGLKLDQKAVDKAVERFTQLQKVLAREKEVKVTKRGLEIKINSAMEDTLDNVKLNIMNDETWKYINIGQMHRDKTPTLFTKVQSCLGGAHDLNYHNDDYRKIFEKRLEINQELYNQKNTLEEQSKELSKGTKAFRGSSKQYKSIEKEIKEAARMKKELPNDASVEDYKKYQNKLKSIVQHANEYLDRKKKEGFDIDPKKSTTKKSYTQNRVRLMNEMKKTTESLVNGLESKLKGFEKIQTRIEEKKNTIQELKEKIELKQKEYQAKLKMQEDEKSKEAKQSIKNKIDKDLEKTESKKVINQSKDAPQKDKSKELDS